MKSVYALIGKSAVDEYGGYWDYDLSNATFDAINDLREENGLPRLTYSLKVQEWADTRSREIWIVDERDGDISHTRPDGSVFASVGYGCNAENALIGLITTKCAGKLKQMVWLTRSSRKYAQHPFKNYCCLCLCPR